MNVLETRYRSVLRLLPKSYRDTWEDDMVDTFLQSVATDDEEDARYVADYGRPPWSEIASVVGLAVRLRLGGTGAPARAALWGDAVRIIALVWLLTHAVWATAGIATTVWFTGRIEWMPAPPEEVYAIGQPTGWQIAWSMVGLVWVAAYFALLAGHRKPAFALVGVGFVNMLAHWIADFVQFGSPPGILVFAFDAVLVLALVAFHAGAPRVVRPARWRWALPASLVVEFGFVTLLTRVADAVPFDMASYYFALLVPVVGVHLAWTALTRTRSAPAWTLALALLTGWLLSLRLVTWLDYKHFGPELLQTGLAWTVIQTATLVVLGAVLTMLAAHALRALPDSFSRTDTAIPS